MDKPYDEEKDEFGVIKRTFYETADSDEFVWHRDHEDRVVIPLAESNWMLQFDNELPIKLNVNEEYFIPKNTFHRVIKGSGNLMVEIIETTFELDDYEILGEGEKSKKKSVNENVDKATINRFLSDFGMLTTLNLAKVQSYAKTDEAKNKLAEMQRTLNTFTSKYFDVIDPTKNTELYKPETLSKIIGRVGEYLNYIKPHIEQLVKDCEVKDAWLKKIQDLSGEYLRVIGKTNENRVYLIKNMLNENSEVLDVVEVFSIYNSEDSHTLEPEVKPIEKPTTVPVKRPDSPYTPKRRTKSKPKANK